MLMAWGLQVRIPRPAYALARALDFTNRTPPSYELATYSRLGTHETARMPAECSTRTLTTPYPNPSTKSSVLHLPQPTGIHPSDTSQTSKAPAECRQRQQIRGSQRR
ncbi:hypothetical protein EJ04DRAFT_517187 [Polyplosphaeria fusca]|uniref:Uncharacterized protein n=1 Tax=Polyplosphaeria fusca TaxID=682080 RepID=A0A9P4QMH8_9PLEO|nr:hypothetical protein EJ04DRAFT_517187 [Polyplosphaeria fusca]